MLTGLASFGAVLGVQPTVSQMKCCTLGVMVSASYEEQKEYFCTKEIKLNE